MWITSGYNSWSNIFSYGGSGDSQCFGININNSQNNNWAFTGYSSGDFNTGVQVAPYVEKWTHVAVTYAGGSGGALKIYLNGILIGSTTKTLNTTGSTFCIGGSEHSGFGENFTGYISDFRVYEGVEKYTESFIVPATEPDILPDTPSGITSKTNLTKITEGAVVFSGSTNRYLDAGSALINTNNSFCVEAFAYLNNDPSSGDMGMICSQYTGGVPAGRMLYGFQDGYLALRINGGTVELQSAAGSAGSKRWYHTAWTWDGTTHRLFLDGKLVDSSTTVPAPYTGVNTEIGGNGNLLLDMI